MDLRHLRYFIAVAEEGNLTRAAERLWIAQPGLSQQILALERELDVQLFRRLARGVEMTDAGRLFLEKARIAVNAAEDALAVAKDGAAGIAGTLRLGINWHSQYDVMSALEREYRAIRPRVDLVVIEAQSDTLLDHLQTQRLDAAVVLGAPRRADQESLRLSRNRIGVLMSRTHRLAARDVLTGADLRDERFVVSGDRGARTYDMLVRRTLASTGVLEPQFLQGGYGLSMLRQVRDSGALMLLSAQLAMMTEDIVAKPLVPVHRYEIHLVWTGGVVSGPLQALIDLCRDRPAGNQRLMSLAA